MRSTGRRVAESRSAADRACRARNFGRGGRESRSRGLRETPDRVARMYAEMFSGLHEDPRTHLQKFFTEQYDEVVLVRDISFNSMCEHHMLPFMGGRTSAMCRPDA